MFLAIISISRKEKPGRRAAGREMGKRAENSYIHTELCAY